MRCFPLGRREILPNAFIIVTLQPHAGSSPRNVGTVDAHLEIPMIHANCRVRLTADDFSFIVGVLSKTESDRVSLVKLLTDEDTRDAILDHDTLANAILNSPERLPISPQLLFYVLCRKVLQGTSVRSRESSDYVASLLHGFIHTTRMESSEDLGQRSFKYISDMLDALARAGTREAFLIRSHIANYALFISGVFADNVEMRTRKKGAPDLKFYEEMGRMNYRSAAEYREAKKFNLQQIYEELSGGFHEVRVALNDMAGRLLHLDVPRFPIVAT